MVAVPAGSFKSNVETQSKAYYCSSQILDVIIECHISEIATSNTEALGMVLYTDYFLAFELAAIILLVAIVSAITLVHRGARTI